jgi:hypothetical protein
MTGNGPVNTAVIIACILGGLFIVGVLGVFCKYLAKRRWNREGVEMIDLAIQDIPPDQVNIGKVIGNGSFGVVSNAD